MKIRAAIPAQRLDVPGGVTYRTEVMECDVAVLHRVRTDCHRHRYYYVADVLRPPRCSATYQCFTGASDTVRVQLVRKLNPTWEPPVFANGSDVLVLCEVQRLVNGDAPADAHERDTRTLDMFEGAAGAAVRAA